MDIIVYTDGSTLNNQHKGHRKGGIGVFFGDNDSRNKSIKLIESSTNKVTNQVAEISACIEAIESINKDTFKSILIKSDSMYTINCITKWCKTWEKKGWKKSDGKIIENLELIQKLYKYSNDYNVKYEHIKAHKSQPPLDSPKYADWYGNMMADKLATSASMSISS
jgi:ribonuclease HI